MTVKSLRKLIDNQTKKGSYASLPFMASKNGKNVIMWFEYDMKYSNQGIDMLIRYTYSFEKDCTVVIKSRKFIETHLPANISYLDFDEYDYYKKLINMFYKDDIVGALELLKESESAESFSIYNFISGNTFDAANY